MRIFGTLFGVLLIAGIVLLLNSFYTVRQDQQALVLRFGDPVVTRNAPGTDEAGLYFKIPLFETVTLMDRKNIGTEVNFCLLYTSDAADE